MREARREVLMPDLPLCVHCHTQRVKREGKHFCSRACFHASRVKPPKRCKTCHALISKQAIQCMECAQVGTRQHLARCRPQALAVNRQRYIERLRAKFSRPQTKTEIRREGYRAGYQACWQSFQRAIRRGDIIVVRERKITRHEAA